MTYQGTRPVPTVLDLTHPYVTVHGGDLRSRAQEAMHDVLEDALVPELSRSCDLDVMAARCASIALEIVAEAATPAALALMWADTTDHAVQRALTCLDECL